MEDLESQITQPRISNIQNSQLTKLVPEVEIENVLKDINPDKTMGSNGFPSLFFQNFWHHIKHEVIHAVQYFFSSGLMSKSWNKTYITFVPKKDNPKQPSNFHAISLYNTAYKIVAKILVNQF